MLALLDGDIFMYRAAASAENDPVEVAIWRARDSIELCLEATYADEFQLWLSDAKEHNFRYAIYPEYKANRTQPKPKHLESVRQYLLEDWQANIATGQEADDALGIEQYKRLVLDDIDDFEEPLEFKSVICSIDKDLLMIPGKHFNFVRQEFKEVSPDEAIRHFYKQTLIGDTADNVFGVRGVGAVKAAKRIDPLETEEEMFLSCLSAYEGDRERLVMNGKVLWIRRQPEQQWEPPIGPDTTED